MGVSTLVAYLRGEPKVWSVVRVPSVAEEDARRLHREALEAEKPAVELSLTNSQTPVDVTQYDGELASKDVTISADIITPTAQNLANLEADMRAFAPTVVDRPQDEFLLAIEQLVRAYDPCLSCSVH